jgi:hypothetical protein
MKLSGPLIITLLFSFPVIAQDADKVASSAVVEYTLPANTADISPVGQQDDIILPALIIPDGHCRSNIKEIRDPESRGLTSEQQINQDKKSSPFNFKQIPPYRRGMFKFKLIPPAIPGETVFKFVR